MLQFWRDRLAQDVAAEVRLVMEDPEVTSPAMRAAQVRDVRMLADFGLNFVGFRCFDDKLSAINSELSREP